MCAFILTTSLLWESQSRSLAPQDTEWSPSKARGDCTDY